MTESELHVEEAPAPLLAPPRPAPPRLTERGRQARTRRARAIRTLRYPSLAVAYLVLPFFLALRWIGRGGVVLNTLGRLSRDHRRWRLRQRRYRPTASDVIVCTYFKCGTNWALQIAHQVAQRGGGDFEHVHDVVPWPDEENRTWSVGVGDDTVREASPTGLRVIKTHATRENVPFTDEARYIYVSRDPKDAFVSGYHFLGALVFGPLMPKVSIWLDFFLSKNYLMGAWPEHVAGYWAERHRPNVLFLTFEEMKQDLPAAVRRIAEFMEVRLTPAEFDEVCRRSTFEYMKTVDRKFHPGWISPLGSVGSRIMRRGRSGGSSELLDREQQLRIDDHCRRELERLGSDLPYDELASPVD